MCSSQVKILCNFLKILQRILQRRISHKFHSELPTLEIGRPILQLMKSANFTANFAQWNIHRPISKRISKPILQRITLNRIGRLIAQTITKRIGQRITHAFLIGCPIVQRIAGRMFQRITLKGTQLDRILCIEFFYQ